MSFKSRISTSNYSRWVAMESLQGRFHSKLILQCIFQALYKVCIDNVSIKLHLKTHWIEWHKYIKKWIQIGLHLFTLKVFQQDTILNNCVLDTIKQVNFAIKRFNNEKQSSERDRWQITHEVTLSKSSKVFKVVILSFTVVKPSFIVWGNANIRKL